jgi:hypothetical protein
VRLTVNLEPELYAAAKSLAKAEQCSISSAVNRMLRRSLRARREPTRGALRLAKRNGFVISRGKQPVATEMVRRSEAEDV